MKIMKIMKIKINIKIKHMNTPTHNKEKISLSYSVEDYISTISEKKETISKLSDESICKMIGQLPDDVIENSLGKFKKMSDQGENSSVYSLPKEGLALKIMENNQKNKRELDFYMYFSENYLHYPVIYKDIECRACHLNDLEKKDDCMVILSELYDGTLKSIKNTLSKEQILSMIIQVVYACSVLEQLELVHGDLHTANILYKNISDDTIPIEIGEKTYPLKTYGKLWVLWDFGNMTYTGETIPIVEIKAIDTLHTDLYKLLVLVNKNYLNYLNELIDHKTIKTVKELIEYLFNRYPTLCE
jgi:hypothetical protein